MKRVQNLIQSIGRQTGQAARDLLYQTREQDPSLFILHLLAGAVACRATRIQVRNDEMDLVMEWNGKAPDTKALLELYTVFETATRDERTRYLALGLSYAFATEIGQLELESWDGAQGVRLSMSPTGQQQQMLRLDPFEGKPWCLRVRCRERSKIRSLVRAVTHLSASSGLAELALLGERGQWAGPEIVIDGGKISRDVELGRCLAWFQLGSAELESAYALRVLRPRHGFEYTEGPESPFAAAGAFAASQADWKGLRILVNGVMVVTPVPLAFRDLSVVVSCPHLEADVAFQEAVSNPGLELIVDVVQTVACNLATRLIERSELIGFDQAEVAMRVFEDLARLQARLNRPEQVVAALRKSLEYREQCEGVADPELISGWTQLLEWNRKLQQPLDLEPIYQRLIPMLRASAENLMRKHRPDEATALIKRALELEEQLPNPPAGLADRFHLLAVTLKEHRLPGAEEMFQKALALRKNDAQDPTAALTSLLELADQLRSNRRYAEAEVQALQALQMAEKAFGSESKQLVPSLKMLATILKAANRYAEATDYESRAMLLRFKR